MVSRELASGLCVLAGHPEKQSFHPPLAGEVLLFCLSKREVPKRKRHPAYALSGRPCPESTRARCGVCRQSIHGLTSNWSASLRTTLRAFLHPPAASEGPGQSNAHPARAFQHSEAKCRSRTKLCFYFQLFTECGQDGPLLYPGPLCGGEEGTTARAAGIDTDVDAFSPGHESGRKARPRITDLPPINGRQALRATTLDEQLDRRHAPAAEGGAEHRRDDVLLAMPGAQSHGPVTMERARNSLRAFFSRANLPARHHRRVRCARSFQTPRFPAERRPVLQRPRPLRR
jgi:hypothetical protein